MSTTADLIRVLKAELKTAGITYAQLAAELALAERYLAIEQVRFGERLLVDWKLDPAAAGTRLPALVLQPLVENAVRHGIEPSSSGGRLRIETHASTSMVHIRITNTLPPPGTETRPGAGIALRNVRERLFLLHDVALRFDAGVGRDGLWRVRISCPRGPADAAAAPQDSSATPQEAA